MHEKKTPLLPLFLVSLVSIGFEISLTRYFAIANWSEYGYWVISITMVGLGASGVVLSLFNNFFVKHRHGVLLSTPLFLMIFICGGFYFTTINAFNPLEFQNKELWLHQLFNIFQYYLVLFPFFFMTGLYIGLYFLAFQEDIPKIYAADLAGAGLGALIVLFFMSWVHPFYLYVSLLPFLAIAAAFYIYRMCERRHAIFYLITGAVFLSCFLFSSIFNRADFNEYKSIYPPLHVPDSKVVEEVKSPRGYFLLLDNFTERLDVDLSNNSSMMGISGTPKTYGLYNDGSRLTSLPGNAVYDPAYTKAALDTFPYELTPSPEVLLIGTRGGFRIMEAVSLKASSITALEPDEMLYSLVDREIKTHPERFTSNAKIDLHKKTSFELFANGGRRYDIVDIAADFLGQTDISKYAFTEEAVRGYLGVIKEGGIVSIPVSMREFTVYAVKMLETARKALAEAGVERPEEHILVYRSSWNCRILLSNRPFGTERIERLKKFCDERSFDISFYPGIKPGVLEVWNDLPVISFDDETVSTKEKASDALMEDAVKLFSKDNASFFREHFFNLYPSTYDRPYFFSILRLSKIKSVLNRIAIIPREEIGYLINIAVFLQSIVFAAVVLILPLLHWKSRLPERSIILKSILYFAGLGVGFLFLEIFFIEKASFYLGDRTYAFAVVLTLLLVFSGLGSYLSSAFSGNPEKGSNYSCAVVIGWIILSILFMDRLILSTLGMSLVVKCLIVSVMAAPLSISLGFLFPLGLSIFKGERSNFLPWAWGINGAFSVISTPLANLISISLGFKMVLWISLFIYIIVYLTFPVLRRRV